MHAHSKLVTVESLALKLAAVTRSRLVSGDWAHVNEGSRPPPQQQQEWHARPDK